MASRVPPITPDQERWAEALAIERLHGGNGARFIAERAYALAAAGDVLGLARFREIAERYERLLQRRRDD